MVIQSRQWVDMEKGLIDRSIFVSQELYEQELERVFARSWLFVGHESQIPNPGDYITNTMGEDPVLITRTRTGKISVMLNSCRHRGNAVTRANLGSARNFMCAYHGWTYDLEGKLITVPGYKELYHEDLKMEEWGLVKCPQVESFHGLIFANWDPHAISLLDYMGEFAWFLETRVNPTGHGSELNGGIYKWTMDHNWKFAADNFVGDGYHGITHKSAMLVGHTTLNSRGQMRQVAGDISWKDNGRSFRLVTKYGHGAGLTVRPEDDPIAKYDDPILADYYRQRFAEVEKRLGNFRARIGGYNAMFPNFSINSSADQIHLWHPRGPRSTDSWVYILVDKGAPPEVKAALAKSAQRHFGPTGMFEQDDSDNWRLSTTGCKTVIGRNYPLHYGQGVGHEPWVQPDPSGPKMIAGVMNEVNQRNFYRQWQDMMNSGG